MGYLDWRPGAEHADVEDDAEINGDNEGGNHLASSLF